MVKQADHNSPLWKGQRGEGRIYIFTISHFTDAGGSLTLDKFAMVSSSKYSSLYFFLVRGPMTV